MEGPCEAVVSRLSDSAQSGRINLLVLFDDFQEGTDTINIRGALHRHVTGPSISYNVVHDDDATLLHDALGLRVVDGVALLIRIDEGEVKGVVGSKGWVALQRLGQ